MKAYLVFYVREKKLLKKVVTANSLREIMKDKTVIKAPYLKEYELSHNLKKN